MSFYLPPRAYPADVYLGQGGEVNATYRPADTPPDIGEGVSSCDYLATGDSTNGAYGLYRWNMGPKPGGPDAHFHRSLSEAFFVLSGTIKLYNGTEWIDGRAGDFLYVPEGGLHGFRNESGEPASMLIMFSPGAPRESYFEGLAARARDGLTPTDDELTEFYLQHDTFWA